MASMQECLLQRKLDQELPERVAERDLQAAKARLLEDKRDILAIKNWHNSTIKQRMVEWQNQYLQPPEYKTQRVCPFEGEVLFCDEKVKEEQDLVRIVDTKEPLVAAWYGEKQGLTDVLFRLNQKGTLRYMGFGFYSADAEEKVLSRCLSGRRDFDGHVRASLSVLRARARLPVNVLKLIKQFLPEYLEHLKQEKERVETKAPRW
mmetsp:Transcript_35778/g.100624  ORF Transcript_35778/g.100624 Transcript_35778/m.100624 type:complete len:205 (+) Transcript_35778:60-674(+)